MTWTEEELDVLKKAYAAGTLSVSYDGKSVTYGSEADLLRRIRTIERELDKANGKAASRVSFASFRKG